MKIIFPVAITITLLKLVLYSNAILGDDKTSVVPRAEHDSLASVPGPKKTEGIQSLEELGFIPLDKEIIDLKKSKLRLRKLVIKPGGTVALHQHKNRPGIAYIVSGEMTEFREGKKRIHKQGSIALENTGVIHGWKNNSQKEATAIVVDIVPQ